MSDARRGAARARTGKRGLLLVPEFPYDSFWSYRYVLHLIGRKAAFPPLGLLTFAAHLPDEWELELVDLNVRVPPARVLASKIAEADAVFVSAMSIQKRSLVEVLAGPAKGSSTPFVLGGPFASSYRDQILEPVTASDRVLHDGLDVLVWGEAAASMEELLAYLATDPAHTSDRPTLLIPRAVRDVEPGSRRYVNDRSLFRPLDDVPAPRWDLIRVKDYHSMMIQTTAGCPFRCDFCDIIQFNGGFNRPKPPDTVTRELEAILSTGYRGSVFSVDDNFIGTPAGIARVLDAIIAFQREHDYPFTFYTQASVNLGSPALAHLVAKMKRAGFDAVFLGIENPDADALRSMNKKQNLKVDVPEAVSRIQAAGIEVYAGFILGSDGDTPSTADQIVEFIQRTRIFTAMTGMLTPIPHTPLYERLRGEGRLLPTEFSGNNTDDHVQFEPRGMTVAELREGIDRVLYRLFDRREAYGRALDMLRSVPPHIFGRRRTELRYLKGALASFWKQGVSRMDRAYFALLWKAHRRDRELLVGARRQARRLGRLLHAKAGAKLASLRPDPERMEELVGMAQDYLVRFRPDIDLEPIAERFAELRGRVRAGLLPPEEARRVYADARRYLRVARRRYRFPGVHLARAFEAAIKGLHYERVMISVVGGGGGASGASREAKPRSLASSTGANGGRDAVAGRW